MIQSEIKARSSCGLFSSDRQINQGFQRVIAGYLFVAILGYSQMEWGMWSRVWLQPIERIVQSPSLQVNKPFQPNKNQEKR
ncbi:hypothetical protein A3194_06155 [Candidatus Thiodiazotropha endoloripes]|nr:hypothetical protein A3194_06155 [Candidatus Thiodiazotropha endoloripes]